MRLLVLGGTEFAGRAIAEEALRREWQVTLFNRGRKDPPLEATSIFGDRTDPRGLSALFRSGHWDVVVDTWSGPPRPVRDTTRVLRPQATRYVYISSRSVYTYPAAAGLTEDGPVVAASPDATEADYAEAKRGAELAVEAAFGDQGLLARAGLILGPYENAGRLLWWLSRIARGGPVLAPGPRDLPLQYIDARDLAIWCLDAVENQLGGAYNLVSAPGHTTMGELLDTCVRVTGSDARLRWFDPATLLAAGIEPWTDLPIWLPPGELYDTLYQGDVSKALSSGLRCRPVAETVADTWEWLRQLPETPSHGVGLDPQVEAKLLETPG